MNRIDLGLRSNVAIRLKPAVGIARAARGGALGAIVLIVIVACGGGGGGGAGDNSYAPPPSPPPAGPTVTLTASSAVNRLTTLSASPTAANGVSKVEFLVDDVIVGTSTSSPYQVQWDSGTVGDGPHTVRARVTDNNNQTGTSSAMTVTVDNVIDITLRLSPTEEVPRSSSTASGDGQLTVNLSTGAVSGQFTLSGMTASAAHIHDGYAGDNGAVVIGFGANATVANRWDLPSGTILTPAQVETLLEGEFYVNAHSTTYPTGEVRAQIKPSNITVIFAAMDGGQVSPAVTTTANGVAAVTVDSAKNQATAIINAVGVDTATAANIRRGASGANGAVVFQLTQHSSNLGRWLAKKQSVTAAQLGDFNGNLWYANVETPANTSGEIRGQITVNAVAATTLTQLQTTIFSISCAAAGCHGGAAPAGSLNLSSASASYAALVNVASSGQPSVLRVKPNDPANSYLIQKLEGAPSAGARMPFGGPYLSQATIDQVKSWINSGAPNN